MGRPRSAALEALVIGLHWTVQLQQNQKHQHQQPSAHATCRTQDDDDVSLPIVSCYRSYMQPRAFATSVSRCTTRRSYLQGRVQSHTGPIK
jgi:hypothetical protein